MSVKHSPKRILSPVPSAGSTPGRDDSSNDLFIASGSMHDESMSLSGSPFNRMENTIINSRNIVGGTSLVGPPTFLNHEFLLDLERLHPEQFRLCEEFFAGRRSTRPAFPVARRIFEGIDPSGSFAGSPFSPTQSGKRAHDSQSEEHEALVHSPPTDKQPEHDNKKARTASASRNLGLGLDDIDILGSQLASRASSTDSARLSQGSITAESQIIQIQSAPAVQTGSQSKTQSQNEGRPNSEGLQNTHRIPPIILRDKNAWSSVESFFLKNNYVATKAQNTSEGIRIFPASVTDFRKMTSLLHERQLPYHTFELPEEKVLRVVIRGIPCEVSCDRVLEGLVAQGYHPISATRMQFTRHRQPKKPMPLVLVKLPRNESSIYNLSRLVSLVVQVEPLKSKGPVGQCHRCQRFGHAQSRCTAPRKCVKCGSEHEKGSCKLREEDDPICANCGGPHPASYRGCPRAPHIRTPSRPTRNRALTPNNHSVSGQIPSKPSAAPAGPRLGNNRSAGSLNDSKTVSWSDVVRAGPAPPSPGPRGGPTSSSTRSSQKRTPQRSPSVFRSGGYGRAQKSPRPGISRPENIRTEQALELQALTTQLAQTLTETIMKALGPFMRSVMQISNRNE